MTVCSMTLSEVKVKVTSPWKWIFGHFQRLSPSLAGKWPHILKLGHNTYDHVTHLLRDLHWLRVPERIQFRLAVLAFCCRNHKAPSYLADDLHWTDEAESRHRLRSGSCPRLIVPRTRLSTIGDRSFRVTVAQAWNHLPTSVTASTSLPSFKRQLKTFLFTKSFPSL